VLPVKGITISRNIARKQIPFEGKGRYGAFRRRKPSDIGFATLKCTSTSVWYGRLSRRCRFGKAYAQEPKSIPSTIVLLQHGLTGKNALPGTAVACLWKIKSTKRSPI